MWTDYSEPILFKEYLQSHNPYETNNAANDEVVQKFINSFYKYRRLCCEDLEQFQYYFDRSIDLYYNQYIELLRIEKTKIDPCVTHYLERLKQTTNTASASASDSTTTDNTKSTSSSDTRSNKLSGKTDNTQNTTTNGSDDSTRTDDLKTDTNGSINNKTAGTKTSESENTDHKIDVGSDMPQSNVSSATQGIPDSIPWTYASRLNESKGDGTNKTTDSFNDSSDTTNSETTTNTGTTTTKNTNESTAESSGNITTSQEETGTSTGTGTETGKTTTSSNSTNESKDENTEKEVSTGREQSAQELLSSAYNYISNTNAAKWLIDQIAPCFYMIL